VETVWVLDRVYGLSNHEVAKAAEGILDGLWISLNAYGGPFLN